MRLLVTKVKYINQTSSDPNSKWAQARFAWVKQLAIRFGKLNPYKPPLAASNTKGSINMDVADEASIHECNKSIGMPDFFNPAKLSKLNRS